jgi:DNA-binding CsgD family transcriptional regulator
MIGEKRKFATRKRHSRRPSGSAARAFSQRIRVDVLAARAADGEPSTALLDLSDTCVTGALAGLRVDRRAFAEGEVKRGNPRRNSEGATSAGSRDVPLPLRAPRDLSVWWLDVGEEAFALLEVPPAPRLADVDASLLSGAEREVAGLMLAGLTNEEIARERGAAPRTVANQVASVFKKLKVQSRRELWVLAATGAKERP